MSSRQGRDGGEGSLPENAKDQELERQRTLQGGVGEIDESTGGIGVGIASKDSKPSKQIDNAKFEKKDNSDPKAEMDAIREQEDALDQDEEAKSDTGPKEAVKEKLPYKERNEAFNDYKESEGKSFSENIKSNRDELNLKKAEFKNLKEQCNRAKAEIDQIKVKLDAKNDEKQKSLELDEEEDVIDEEEFTFIKEMKDFKRAYRTSYDKLKNIKGDIYLIQQNIDQLKMQLVSTFEVWYEDNIDQSNVIIEK